MGPPASSEEAMDLLSSTSTPSGIENQSKRHSQEDNDRPDKKRRITIKASPPPEPATTPSKNFLKTRSTPYKANSSLDAVDVELAAQSQSLPNGDNLSPVGNTGAGSSSDDGFSGSVSTSSNDTTVLCFPLQSQAVSVESTTTAGTVSERTSPLRTNRIAHRPSNNLSGQSTEKKKLRFLDEEKPPRGDQNKAPVSSLRIHGKNAIGANGQVAAKPLEVSNNYKMQNGANMRTQRMVDLPEVSPPQLEVQSISPRNNNIGSSSSSSSSPPTLIPERPLSGRVTATHSSSGNHYPNFYKGYKIPKVSQRKGSSAPSTFAKSTQNPVRSNTSTLANDTLTLNKQDFFREILGLTPVTNRNLQSGIKGQVPSSSSNNRNMSSTSRAQPVARESLSRSPALKPAHDSGRHLRSSSKWEGAIISNSSSGVTGTSRVSAVPVVKTSATGERPAHSGVCTANISSAFRQMNRRNSGSNPNRGYTPEQLTILQETLQNTSKLRPSDIFDLQSATGLQPKQIKDWFRKQRNIVETPTNSLDNVNPSPVPNRRTAGSGEGSSTNSSMDAQEPVSPVLHLKYIKEVSNRTSDRSIIEADIAAVENHPVDGIKNILDTVFTIKANRLFNLVTNHKNDLRTTVCVETKRLFDFGFAPFSEDQIEAITNWKQQFITDTMERTGMSRANVSHTVEYYIMPWLGPFVYSKTTRQDGKALALIVALHDLSSQCSRNYKDWPWQVPFLLQSEL